MKEFPIVVTQEDVNNPQLLYRLLQVVTDKLVTLGAQTENAGKDVAKKIPSHKDIKESLQSTGSHPINITGLRGTSADPQLAGTPRFSAVPTGLELQRLQDTQMILVKNGASYDIYTVIGGNPNTLIGPL